MKRSLFKASSGDDRFNTLANPWADNLESDTFLESAHVDCDLFFDCLLCFLWAPSRYTFVEFALLEFLLLFNINSDGEKVVVAAVVVNKGASPMDAEENEDGVLLMKSLNWTNASLLLFSSSS